MKCTVPLKIIRAEGNVLMFTKRLLQTVAKMMDIIFVVEINRLEVLLAHRYAYLVNYC